MMAERLSGERIRIPVRVEDPETGMIGDGTEEIGPGDSRWEMWNDWLKDQEQQAR